MKNALHTPFAKATFTAIVLIFLGLGWITVRKGIEQKGFQAESETPAHEAPQNVTYSKEGDSEGGDLLSNILPGEAWRGGINPALRNGLEDLVLSFRNASDQAERLSLYRELLLLIQDNRDAGAAETVAAFLRSGTDAETGLPFVLGFDGSLTTTTSVRVALIDQLGIIDLELAIKLSRELMDGKSTADEYTVALRNLAWSDFDGSTRDEVERRFSAMLDQTDWLANPSGGFLEAFDVAVELSSPRAFDDLASVLLLEDEQGSPVANGVSDAAFLAMDRIMLREAGMVATQYLSKPDQLDFAPNHRASLLSRLSLNNPAERDAFRAYLNASNHGEGELDYFGELYPNGNFFHGNRIVTTQEDTPSLVEMRKSDQAALQEIEHMIESGEVAGPTVERIRERLLVFVEEAMNNPLSPEDPSLRIE